MKNNRKLIKIQIIGIFVMLVVGLFIVAGVQGAEEEKATLEYKPKADIQVEESQPVEQVEVDSDVTLGQRNALKKAQNYFKIISFSKKGLEEQLVHDGFTQEEAQYASDNCMADWSVQAGIQAERYLKLMSYSRQELLDQLLFDGYTQEQAEYGVSTVGY